MDRPLPQVAGLAAACLSFLALFPRTAATAEITPGIRLGIASGTGAFRVGIDAAAALHPNFRLAPELQIGVGKGLLWSAGVAAQLRSPIVGQGWRPVLVAAGSFAARHWVERRGYIVPASAKAATIEARWPDSDNGDSWSDPIPVVTAGLGFERASGWGAGSRFEVRADWIDVRYSEYQASVWTRLGRPRPGAAASTGTSAGTGPGGGAARPD